MQPNLFAQGMDAFDRSYDRFEAMRQQRARKRSGGRLAAGDQRGAVEGLQQAGMIDEARVLENDARRAEQEQYDRGRSMEADQRRQAEQQSVAAP